MPVAFMAKSPTGCVLYHFADVGKPSTIKHYNNK